MPKVYMTDAQRIGERQYKQLKQIYFEKGYKDDKEIYNDIGISSTSFSKRKSRSFYLKTTELQQIAKRRRLSDEEILRIVKGENKNPSDIEHEVYHGYLCDPNKATTCKKTNCYYENGDKNACRYTTNPRWRREDK